MKEKKIILDLCGGTGAWSKPYKDNGYEVINVTLPYHDVLTYKAPKNVYGVLAAPPCTMFSIARNDKTARNPRDLREGMKIILACMNIIWEQLYDNFRADGLKFWALENPASGYLKKFLGKPALEFHPYEYGDPYTKKTALWGMFNEPKKNPVNPERGTMVKYASNFKDIKPVDPQYQKDLGIDARTIRRSITPEGFAQAFFEANN